MGPWDDGGGEGMSIREASAAATERDRLRAECPHWECWPIRLYEGRRNVWSARPDGAAVAVIEGRASVDDLRAAIRQYEADVQRHLDDARQMLAAVPNSGIGRDSAAVLAALVTALEAMAERLTG